MRQYLNAKSHPIILVLVSILVASTCVADDGKTPAHRKSPASEESPADRPSSGDTETDRILDRLEAKGKAISGLASKLTYKYVTGPPVEDTMTKLGRLLFKRALPGQTNSMFLIEFDKRIADGAQMKRIEKFAFDGEWLTEFNETSRSVTRRQIVRQGERIDPFKLGSGPFPMPFGQKRDEILHEFDVTRQKPELEDLPGTTHLHCVPRPGTQLSQKYSRVEIYIDRKIELPIRIVSESKKDGSRIEVDFKEIDISAAPAGSRFTIKCPDGFQEQFEPLPPLVELPMTEKEKPASKP